MALRFKAQVEALDSLMIYQGRCGLITEVVAYFWDPNQSLSNIFRYSSREPRRHLLTSLG